MVSANLLQDMVNTESHKSKNDDIDDDNDNDNESDYDNTHTNNNENNGGNKISEFEKNEAMVQMLLAWYYTGYYAGLAKANEQFSKKK